MSSRLEKYMRMVISAEQPVSGLAPSLIRGCLGGMAGLYDAGLETYLAAEKVGLRRRDRLPVPVLSIGNLSVGGTGKTPMTAMICQRLSADGKRLAILSRGHGGTSVAARFVSDGSGEIFLSAEEAGDEPVLLAQECPHTPVLVGKDRRLSGREALRRLTLDAFVLDDGFQFWQLFRDLDIVLLDASRPFDNGYPLPRGLLREPARHLQRAGVVVVTRSDLLGSNGREKLRQEIGRYARDIEVFFARHAPSNFVSVGSPTTGPVPVTNWHGVRCVAISGIAQPDSFHRTLNGVGIEVVAELIRSDHHKFVEADIIEAQKAAKDTSADAIIMTRKDAVKWPADSSHDGVPAYALHIEMQVEDESRFLAIVRTTLFGSSQASSVLEIAGN